MDDLLVPLVLIVAAATAMVLVPGKDGLPNPVIAGGTSSAWHWVLTVGFSLALVAAIALTVDLGSAALPLLAGAALVGTWLLLSRAAARRYAFEVDRAGRGRAGSFAAISAAALVAGVCFMPWVVAVAATRGELAEATVCLPRSERVDGSLIGQAGERIYIGESSTRIVLLIDDARLRADLRGALRALEDRVYDVRERRSASQVSFGRIDLVIAQLDALGSLERERVFSESAVPVIGYRETSRAPRDQLFTLVPRELVADETRMAQFVRREIDSDISDRSEPALRIIAIPNSQVRRVVIGDSGACPHVE